MKGCLWKKRKAFLSLGLCLALLLAMSVSCGVAGASRSDYAIVNNPDPTDRLNLRKKPNANADTIGKYYSGHVVEILEYTSKDWVKVSAGDGRVGYMMKSFLVFDSSKYVKSAMPIYTMSKKAWKLYASPSSGAKTVKSFSGGETIQVLGIVYDWWHIQCGNYSGFIPELMSLWKK